MDVVDVYWMFLGGCGDFDEDFLFLEDDDFGDFLVFVELVLFLDVFLIVFIFGFNVYVFDV